LARYAPDDVDTDAKRKEKFLDGLNDDLSIQLSVAYVPTYQALCDKATILESKLRKVEHKKRKHNHVSSNSGSYQKPRTSYGGNKHDHYGHTNHNNGGSDSGNWNGHENGGNSDRHHHNNTKKDISHLQCYNCKELGHYASDCPTKQKNAGNANGAKPNLFHKGHVNHINMGGFVEELGNTDGTFMLTPLHLFMSMQCISFNNIQILGELKDVMKSSHPD
jgi:hypothetical protein